MRILDFLCYPIAINSCNTNAVENYLAFRLTLRKKKCPFLKRKQSLYNQADWAVLPSEVRLESWICPFHQKSTMNSKINWNWPGGWISFNRLMTVATPCYWGLPHSPAFFIYCVLLPLSCSLLLTNDTKNAVFLGGSCGGTVIIWKENKARSLGI